MVPAHSVYYTVGSAYDQTIHDSSGFLGTQWRVSLAVNDALKLLLDTLKIRGPPDGKYTSHLLRMRAHTEKVPLGFPLEARMARFV